MTNYEKMVKARDIAKANGISGKFNFGVSEINSNVVELYCESGLYCTINIRRLQRRFWMEKTEWIICHDRVS